MKATFAQASRTRRAFTLGEHDGPTVDAIVAAMAKDNYRFQRLVFEVVRSSPFTMRRGTKETPK